MTNLDPGEEYEQPHASYEPLHYNPFLPASPPTEYVPPPATPSWWGSGIPSSVSPLDEQVFSAIEMHIQRIQHIHQSYSAVPHIQRIHHLSLVWLYCVAFLVVLVIVIGFFSMLFTLL